MGTWNLRHASSRIRRKLNLKIFTLGFIAFVGLFLSLWRSTIPSIYLPFGRLEDPEERSSSQRGMENFSPHRKAVGSTASWNGWIDHNQRALRQLLVCLERDSHTCRRNQTSVILLASYHFIAQQEGHIGGEEIWAQSTVAALDTLGYTYFFTSHWDGARIQQGLSRTIDYYRMFPDLVKAVIAESDQAFNCFDDPRCILNRDNPYGIPVWKILSFSFWAGPASPLGHKWTLSPEEYNREHSWVVPNTYLGYSVEPGCRNISFLPHEQRKTPHSAFLIAKDAKYLHPDIHAWEPETYREAAKMTGVQFFMGADGSLPNDFPIDVVENLDQMPQDWFYQMLSSVNVAIGVGRPWTSPTMYDALCLGVPVVNPILEWDTNDPSNRDKWVAQHAALKDLDPPYVYNVFKNDMQSFIKAIQSALSNPIESFILERMRMRAVEDRLGRILETDWQYEAENLLEERMKKGETPLFTV
ncbi:hypothetical protein MIND_00792500 [Mycena indigotica]|uniref:Uncharacterized protein n=1 Tax=Mycena indigotica TaxID=2126181 RepID=A0A8H6SM22_9AGAR|nr:uncharacterized protein MIND_00792500 [Mycena indigotica]KAF7302255.1 hypothetical protein MIND_00792500 [Mycena indigotica]